MTVTVLARYIDAWRAHDVERIAASVAVDGVVTESYGPVYRGRDTVRRWAETWFAAGGVVHRWDVADLVVCGDRETAEWSFECTWQGTRARFDGCTVARVEGSLVVALREYQTTAPLYDWTGAWV